MNLRRLVIALSSLLLLLHFVPATVAKAGLSPAFSPQTLVNNMRFERIDTYDANDDSVGPILDIIQDDLGYIWVAGENGLARYNAYEFSYFYFDPNKQYGLASNRVNKMLVDRRGILWLATGEGLCHYNHSVDRFICIESEAPKGHGAATAYTALAQGSENHIYVGSDAGIRILRADHTLARLPEAFDAWSEKAVNSMFFDRDKYLWVGFKEGGLSRLDLMKGTVTDWRHESGNANSIVAGRIEVIAQDDQGNIWLGSDGDGLSRINAEDQTIENFRSNRNDPYSLGADVVRDIWQDSKGNLWILSDHGGLALFNEEEKKFILSQHRKSDPTTLSSDQLRAMFEDDVGNLWLGDVWGVLNYFDFQKAQFTHLRHKIEDDNSLLDNFILSILEDRDGMIWIGSEKGLHSYNPENSRITQYLPDPTQPDKLRFGAITSLVEDADGGIWVGSWSGGLHYFDKRNKKFKNYFPDDSNPASLVGSHVWALQRDAQDNIWVACIRNGGVSRYDKATDSFINYRYVSGDANSLSGSHISALAADQRGSLWIGSSQGLDRLDIESNTISHYYEGEKNGLSEKNISVLMADSDGIVWVGTANTGLNILNPKTDEIQLLTTKQGLPSNQIYSLVDDGLGHIWAGTPRGLARIKRKDFSVVVFKKNDGLVGHRILRNAAHMSSTGKLYIGSAEGISIFDPQQLKLIQTPPKVIISGFRVLNKAIHVGDEGSPLNKAIDHTRKIDLKYKDIMFALDYATLDYRQSSQVTFAYKLEGFDRHWNLMGNKRTATYTNLDAGQYIFKVKAKNRLGYWSEKPREIEINIAPPPWRSWYAYLFYAIVLFSIIIIRDRYRALQKRSDKYQRLASTDTLTLVSNRAGLLKYIDEIWYDATKSEELGIMIIDIDFFKKINDEHGHDVGDSILQQFAQFLKFNIRSSEFLCRWGGEEFIIVCSSLSKEQTSELAERLLKRLKKHDFTLENEEVNLTASFGVASRRAGERFEQLVKRADTALYQAKSSGRACVVSAR